MHSYLSTWKVSIQESLNSFVSMCCCTIMLSYLTNHKCCLVCKLTSSSSCGNSCRKKIKVPLSINVSIKKIDQSNSCWQCHTKHWCSIDVGSFSRCHCWFSRIMTIMSIQLANIVECCFITEHNVSEKCKILLQHSVRSVIEFNPLKIIWF